MGSAASSHAQQRTDTAGAGYRSFEEAVSAAFMVSGTAVGSHGEVVGIRVEANQGAQDDAARGSFDYIWRIQGLPLSSQEDGNFRSQFEAKGLEWEISLLRASGSRDQRSVSVRLYLRGDAPCGWEDNSAKLRLTFAVTLFNQNSCRQDWQRSVNTFADHRDGKWGFKDFIASDAFMDPSNGFVVDGSCAIGVTLLRVQVLRVKKESLLVHHRLVNHEHTWLVRNFSTMEHQCMRREVFEAAGCRWSIYLHRIRFGLYFHDDVLLFLSLDSTTGQKKSITASYQFHVKGLAGGYEFSDACDTNVFVPGQCHGGKLNMPGDVYRESGWSFEQDTCTVRVRLTLIGYAEVKGNDVRALQLEDH